MTQKPIEEELYRNIHNNMPILCVDLVIVKNGAVILTKRTNRPLKDVFWLPGGRVNKMETLKEAAIRKAKEELGITIRNPKMISTEETMFEDGPFEGPTHTVNIVFMAKLEKTEKITLDSQSEKFIWCDKIDNELDPYLIKFLKIAGVKE